MSTQMKVIGNDLKLDTILNRDFLQKRSHYVEAGPEKIVLPGKFEQLYERIENLAIRDDDVFVLGFPKTGTRWLLELCWLLINDLDFETANDTYLWLRAPDLEMEASFDKVRVPFKNLKEIDQMQSPRCIKAHLHWTLLPKAISTGAKQPKIIVTLRGPEDTCTSYYHQGIAVDGYSGTWDDFCELFLAGRVPFGPYWSYVLSLWEQRHRKNVMFVTYNQMKTDLSGCIRKIAAFLGKNLSDDGLNKMVDYLTFDNLKNSPGFNPEQRAMSFNQRINPFVRKGTVGDHKNFMSPSVIEAFSEQRKRYLTETGLTFD